jgi:hypothetical protein
MGRAGDTCEAGRTWQRLRCLIFNLGETAMNPLFGRLLMVAAVGLGLVAMACRANSQCRRQHADEVLDDALQDTFPASDPTASQDFAIPVNRL